MLASMFLGARGDIGKIKYDMNEIWKVDICFSIVLGSGREAWLAMASLE